MAENAAATLRGLVQSLSDSLSGLPLTSLEDVCQTFYDRQILGRADASDPREAFFSSLEDSLAQADRAFAAEVDQESFRLEVTALRLELFGMALTYRVGSQREGLCLRELAATERYLREHDEQRIWARMGFYNERIGEAALRLRRTRRQFGRRLSQRLGLADRWQGSAINQTCLVRFVNRCEGEVAWRQGLGATVLIQGLAERLQCRLNPSGQLRILHLLTVFYDETATRLRHLRLV